MNELNIALTPEPCDACAPGSPITFTDPNKSAGSLQLPGHFIAWTKNQQGVPLAIVKYTTGHVGTVGLDDIQFLDSDSDTALRSLVRIGVASMMAEVNASHEALALERRRVQDYISTLGSMDADSTTPQAEIERIGAASPADFGMDVVQVEAWVKGYNFAIKTVQQFTQAHEISK